MQLRRSRKRRFASASATCARSGKTRREAIAAGQPYEDVADLARRAPVNKAALETLVASGACDRFGARRELLWRVGVVPRPQSAGGGNRQLTLALEPTAPVPDLPPQTDWEQMLADYGTTGLSIGPHPLELLRPHLPAATLSSRELHDHPATTVAVAGMAVARQRPATANGVVFMLLEDEFGAGEPDRPAAGLRALPPVGPRRAAAARTRKAGARRPQPERARRARWRRSARSPARSPARRRCGAPCRGRTISVTASALSARPLSST